MPLSVIAITNVSTCLTDAQGEAVLRGRASCAAKTGK